MLVASVGVTTTPFPVKTDQVPTLVPLGVFAARVVLGLPAHNVCVVTPAMELSATSST
jgi:hypothetical protein